MSLAVSGVKARTRHLEPPNWSLKETEILETFMRRRSYAVLLVLCSLSMTALAVTPQFWENFSQEELLQGTLTRVSLNSDGKLFLAPSYDSVYDTNQPYIFSLVRDKAGNFYVGTGHEGKVFKIDSQGKGSLYYQSKELDIFALALDAADALYVGTSPDGKVYKVTGPNQATEYCNPEDKYIWSMLFDEAGNLFIGTGAGESSTRSTAAAKSPPFSTVPTIMLSAWRAKATATCWPAPLRAGS